MIFQIILRTEHLVIINKPSSIPSYRCGMYQKNNAENILMHENPDIKKKLLALHRLDRVVSGLLIYSTCKVFSTRFINLMKERKVQKYYISRVEGIFLE